MLVRDAVTGAPVWNAYAYASLVAPRATLFGIVGSGWTGTDGTVELGPFEPLTDVVARAEETRAPSEVVLRVQHPDYGDHCRSIEPYAADVDVALTAHCEVAGRVHCGGATPDRRYTVVLESVQDGAELLTIYSLPYIDVTQSDGSFRFMGVRPGRYSVRVSERYFDTDALALAVAQRESLVRYEGHIEVEPARPVHLDVDLTPTGLGPTASVAGTMQANGLPVEGAEVVLAHLVGVVLNTDSAGRFASGEFSAVRGVPITIDGGVALPDGRREQRRLYHEWVTFEPSEQKQIDIDVEFRGLSVEVADAETGAPVRGTAVSVDREDGAAETDTSGIVEVLVDVKGGREVVVRAEGYADA